ncbi:MAG: hypothetical protein O7A04_11595, partial [Acidobacteria bacterium]|nr:hypothetical protein [Acidobacteriota bacterium]
DSGARLFVRRLDSLHAVALPGTDGASTPFFSPDSTELAFFAEGKLKKVPVSAEHPPQTLCDAPWVGGGSWDADGTILLAASEEGPLVRVAASGGVPAAATRLDEQQGERLHRWPQVLPGGDQVLFTSAKRGYDFEDATIQVEALNGGKRTLLLEGAYFGRYLPTGHLLFVRRGTAYVVPLDLDRLVVAGTPTPVVEELLAEPGTGWASLSFSQNGHLVYVKSRAASDDVSIEWVDRQGRSEPLIEGARPWVAPRLSADGRRLALHDGGSIHHSEILESDIWIFDLERRALARVTHDKSPEYVPLWTPEEDRLVFSAEKGGNAPNLYWVPADGSESPEQLTRSDLAQYPNSWTPDGRTLVFIQGAASGFDLWTLDFGANGPVGDPRPLLEAPYRTWRSEISPDGRWLLYTSDESGIFQIYVRPFPDLDGKWQVSAETEHYSNLHARWSRSTPELFYWNGKQMMAVPHQVRGGTFVPGKPLALFGGDFATRSWPEWDVAPDGQRFVMFTEVEDVESPAEAGTPQTVLVLNWFSELAPN